MTNTDTPIFKLPATLTIENAETLAQSVMELSPGTDGLAVDASGIEAIATPCIQILIALDHMLVHAGSKLILVNPSEAFTRALQSLGMELQLKKWGIQ